MYESDPRHAELMIELVDVMGAKLVPTPGMKEEAGAQEGDDAELNDKKSSKCRALAARANGLALDLVDIEFATLQNHVRR